MSPTWSAVILAGGLGSRLNPLTAKKSKPGVPVANRALIDYAIDHLRYAGIKKIVICVKQFGEELKAQIENTWTKEICADLGLEIIIPNNDSHGTADAVRLIADCIDTDHFVVSMADLVTCLPMADMMQFHIEKEAQATVSMKTIEQLATKYGNTLLDDDGKIIRFLEKPTSEEIYLSALTGGTTESLPIINTGVYCFTHEIIELLQKTKMADFGHHVFPYLLEQKYRLFGFLPPSNPNYYWMDVGAPVSYLWANWDMLRLYGWPIQPPGVRQGHHSHKWFLNNEVPGPNVRLGEHIVLGSNNTFGDNVYLKSLVALGSNAQIGSNVIIDRSVIWDNVKIGNNVIIEQSIIANNVEIGDNVIIRSESVIGPDAKITAGKILDCQIIKEDSVA